jgi:hypothetical protein
MDYVNSIINAQAEKLRNLEYNLQFALYCMTVFIVPMLIGHPQMLVGVAVNCALILSAVYLDFKGTLPIIMLPSIAVLTRGIIFGPYTIYLVYVIPLIWIGNAILVYNMKWLYLAKKGSFLFTLGITSALKTAFLFSGAFILVKLSVLPAIFLTTMGLFQLETAIAGGIIAYGAIRARKLILHAEKQKNSAL